MFLQYICFHSYSKAVLLGRVKKVWLPQRGEGKKTENLTYLKLCEGMLVTNYTKYQLEGQGLVGKTTGILVKNVKI